jgi:hypothetical protein
VGGNLIIESLQDKSRSGSHSLGLSAGYSESKDSDGKKSSSGNFGGNFSLSSSNRRWVTEQTSLTGNSVNIYVEKKTTLTGAVIASTSNDLTLNTGSLEFSNIKDKDISYNFGGGVNLGSNSTGKPEEKNNTWSVNVNYGYSERRQTNFATIGEGTIIVRDGKTDLTKLNRDVTISQYGTVDVRLKGAVTVDSSTVDMMTSPVKTMKETYASLEKGYNDAKKTTYDLYDKTGNLIGGEGFYTDGQLRVFRYYNRELAKALDGLIFDSTKIVNGTYFIKDAKGNLTMVDNLYYGEQKNTYTFGELDTITGYTRENFIVVDGNQIKSYELLYTGDSKTFNSYDSSGDNIYRSANYQYSDGTYVLKYVDNWMVGANGVVIKDIKQNDENYAGIIMNDNRLAPGIFGDKADRYNSKNYIGNSGCLLTSAAIVDDFYRGAYGDPKKMDALADRNGIYYNKYSADADLQSLANELKYNADRSKAGNIDSYKLLIDTNIENNVPTIIKYSNSPTDSHFAVLGGTRYNGDGSNDYLIRDPGSSLTERSILDGDTLSNSRGQVKRLDWMTKEVIK